MTACVFRTLRHFEMPEGGWHDDMAVRMLCQDVPTTIDDLRHDFNLIDRTPCNEAEIFTWLPHLEQIVWELVERDYIFTIPLDSMLQKLALTRQIHTPFSQCHGDG